MSYSKMVFSAFMFSNYFLPHSINYSHAKLGVAYSEDDKQRKKLMTFKSNISVKKMKNALPTTAVICCTAVLEKLSPKCDIEIILN